MPGTEIGGGEGGVAGRIRRGASRGVERLQRTGRAILDRFRGRR